MQLTSVLWVSAGVVVLVNFGLGFLVMCPRCKVISSNLVRLPENAVKRGEIVLTFDDGPDAHVTPLILDQLDKYCAKASFFVLARKQPHIRTCSRKSFVEDTALKIIVITTNICLHLVG
jgi:Predicted xylanase/chitin deacetylase